jgi:nicotinate phosphoribosyltransferase
MTYRIINSVADDDRYNFHQGCFLFHNYHKSPTSWTHNNRSKDIDLRPIVPQVKEQLDMMSDLKLTEDEAEHMLKDENCLCTEEYLEYLTKTPIFNPKEIDLKINANNNFDLRYHIPEAGRSTLVEVKTLSMVSELHFKEFYKDNYDEVLASGERWLDEQVLWLKEFGHPKLDILEMGGRRRFSYDHHEKALLKFWNETPEFFKGTSNVHLGMKHNIPSYGTMAHLMFMFMQTVGPLHDSQIRCLWEWHKFFEGKLPVALTDTFGNEKWDRDFCLELSKVYPWERHDSGDPRLWARLRIEAAKAKGLDTADRGLLFSDGLNFKKANDLTAEFSDQTQVGSGIGTFISNSMGVEGHKPISQVCKMTWANNHPTCKLSADPVKAQCEDVDFLVWAKKVAGAY